jgi:hypothetical protein
MHGISRSQLQTEERKMIEYQTDVPLEAGSTRTGRKPSYPFRTMPVGASFFVPNKTVSSIRAAAHHYREEGLHFSAQTVIEDGVKGVRIWRIA